MFPPCYCDKCSPRGEGGGCGRVIFQWFSSNFSAQSGCEQKLQQHAVYFKSAFVKSVFFKGVLFKCDLSKLYFSVVFIQYFCPIRVASKKCYGMECAPQHITIGRGVNPKNHPISCWLLIATTLLISPIIDTVTSPKIFLFLILGNPKPVTTSSPMQFRPESSCKAPWWIKKVVTYIHTCFRQTAPTVF